jgi:hypothetical protein
MLEREAKRKYFWELGLSLLLYVAVLMGSLYFAEQLQPGLARTLIVLTPAIPIFINVWVIARQFRRMDEFVRLRSLESIAVAAAITAGVTFTYGFLESAGFPRQSMFWVWGIMGFTWGMHTCLRRLFAK